MWGRLLRLCSCKKRMFLLSCKKRVLLLCRADWRTRVGVGIVICACAQLEAVKAAVVEPFDISVQVHAATLQVCCVDYS